MIDQIKIYVELYTHDAIKRAIYAINDQSLAASKRQANAVLSVVDYKPPSQRYKPAESRVSHPLFMFQERLHNQGYKIFSKKISTGS